MKRGGGPGGGGGGGGGPGGGSGGGGLNGYISLIVHLGTLSYYSPRARRFGRLAQGGGASCPPMAGGG